MPDRNQPAAMLPRLTLVLGGARSGKSRHAEMLVEAAAPGALYVATAEALDDEMRARIAQHRARRGPRWTTIEEPLALAPVLAAEARAARPILVDCLTLWLSNLMHAERDAAQEISALLAVLPELRGPVVMVANEVGLGIVPENALAREFRDHAGRLNRDIAAASDRVVFIAAGLPLVLKDAAAARVQAETPATSLISASCPGLARASTASDGSRIFVDGRVEPTAVRFAFQFHWSAS